jgi:hypothetical protein
MVRGSKKVLFAALAVVAAMVIGISTASANGDPAFVSKPTSLIQQCGDSWSNSNTFAGGSIQETGVSGTRQFRVTSYSQTWDGTKWNSQGSGTVVTSSVFPNDATSYSWRPKDGAGNEAMRGSQMTPVFQDVYVRAAIQFEWLRVNTDGSRTVLHRHTAADNEFCFVGNIPPPGSAPR